MIKVIIISVYIIGLFITPIILKKFKILEDTYKYEQETLVPVISIIWPLSICIGLLGILAYFLIMIYDKVK